MTSQGWRNLGKPFFVVVLAIHINLRESSYRRHCNLRFKISVLPTILSNGVEMSLRDIIWGCLHILLVGSEDQCLLPPPQSLPIQSKNNQRDSILCTPQEVKSRIAIDTSLLNKRLSFEWWADVSLLSETTPDSVSINIVDSIFAPCASSSTCLHPILHKLLPCVVNLYPFIYIKNQFIWNSGTVTKRISVRICHGTLPYG